MTPGAAVPPSAVKSGGSQEASPGVADGALLCELEEKKTELKNAAVRLERLKNVFNTSVQVQCSTTFFCGQTGGEDIKDSRMGQPSPS